MAQSNVTVKVWRSENIVRDQELVPLQGQLYDSIEAYTGLDEVDQVDLARPVRNMFEQQEKMMNFLASLAVSSKESRGVFKGSLENQLDVAYPSTLPSVTGATDDFIPVILSAVYEQWEFTIAVTADLTDLQNQDIQFQDPSGNDYYVWYNVDGGGTNPALAGTDLEITVISNSETVEDVAEKTASVINLSGVPFDSYYEGALVRISNQEPGNATIPASDSGYAAFNITVTTEGTINLRQYYARIKPGIAFIDGEMIVVKPNLYITERIIEKIYGIQAWEEDGGYCNILYDYATDKYQMKIRLLEGNSFNEYVFKNGIVGDFGDFDTGGDGGGYNSAASMFKALYTNAQIGYQFAYAISESGVPDFTTLPIEPMVKLTENGTDDLYWSIRFGGDLEYSDAPIGGDGVELYHFNYTTGGGSVTVNTASDTRPFFQNFNDFEGDIYLNVPNSWDVSTTNGLDAWDSDGATVSWDEVTNSTTLISILRQHLPSGNDFQNTSAVFGWVEGDVANYDPHGIVTPGTYEDLFFLNKDLFVQYGETAGEFARFSDVASATSAGFPVVELFSGLAGVPNVSDATVAFVRETNQFYRYSGSTGTFIPVSDPHKQFWGQTATIEATGGQTDFTFSGYTWRTDGNNIQVYVNGLFKTRNTPGDTDGDYNVTDYNTISFNSGLVLNDVVVVHVTEGGEDYQADKVIYTAGPSGVEGVYTGDLTEFEVPFQMVQQRVDVYHNGLLLREAESFDTITATAGSDITITDSTKSFGTSNEIDGYYVFIIDSSLPNQFELRKVASHTNNTITLDAILDNSINPGDIVEIFTPYGYFVNEDTEIITLTSAATAGDTIDIRDQAAIVSSYSIQHKGEDFPNFPTFGFEYYREDLDAWFKYTGDGTGTEENPGPPGEWVQI